MEISNLTIKRIGAYALAIVGRIHEKFLLWIVGIEIYRSLRGYFVVRSFCHANAWTDVHYAMEFR